MLAAEVIRLIELLDDHGFDVWIGGGWGVDALLGQQTRPHDDLDILIRVEDEAAVLSLLRDDGFAIVTDWRPVRLALRHPAKGEVDVHPLHSAADGSAWLPDLDGGRFDYPPGVFVTGSIAGREVPCINADQQLRFHLGYQPEAKDRADMEALSKAGFIDLPAGY